jgi:hypothetical protein
VDGAVASGARPPGEPVLHDIEIADPLISGSCFLDVWCNVTYRRGRFRSANGRRSRMASRVATRQGRRAAGGTADDGVDPAFHRAILKIALELKRPNAPSYDDIVVATIRSMRLDAAAFRRYLGENGARNMSLLLATARTMGP